MARQAHEAVRQRLMQRSGELLADIRRELRKQDSERYGDLADRLADPAEHALADLLVDVDLAEISRDVEEFRGIEAALLRIAHGTYGVCADCGETIDAARLASAPAASRCLACQQAFEAADRRERHRTL